MPGIGKVGTIPLSELPKVFDKTPLPGDLPRIMNSRKTGYFKDLKYKSQELDINDQLKATIKVGYIVTELLQKPMRSLDFIFGNKILHIQNGEGITIAKLCKFLDKIGENIENLVKDSSQVEKIKLAILDFWVKY